MSAWMKVELELPEKPEVCEIATFLSIDADAVVGKLLRIWAWFDKHTSDGFARGITAKYIDTKAGCERFAEAMVAARWLKISENGVQIPKFDKHNGETAKKRAETGLRVARHRSLKHEGIGDVTQDVTPDALAREDKIRERVQATSKEKSKRGADAPPPGESPGSGESGDQQPQTKKRARDMTYAQFREACKAAGEPALPANHAIFRYADRIKLPRDFLRLAWREFHERYAEKDNRQAGVKGWRQLFAVSVRANWFKLWFQDERSTWALTTTGKQAQLAHPPAPRGAAEASGVAA